jgi:hypothetical protein
MIAGVKFVYGGSVAKYEHGDYVKVEFEGEIGMR